MGAFPDISKPRPGAHLGPSVLGTTISSSLLEPLQPESRAEVWRLCGRPLGPDSPRSQPSCEGGRAGGSAMSLLQGWREQPAPDAGGSVGAEGTVKGAGKGVEGWGGGGATGGKPQESFLKDRAGHRLPQARSRQTHTHRRHDTTENCPRLLTWTVRQGCLFVYCECLPPRSGVDRAG